MENVLFKISFPAEFHAQTAVECAMTLHPSCGQATASTTSSSITIRTHEVGIRIIDKKGPLEQSRRPRPLHPVHGGRAADLRPADRRRLRGRDRRRPAHRRAARQDGLRRGPAVHAATTTIRTSARSPMRSPSSSRTARKLDEVVVEYPIGHTRRRKEGIPLLVEKFKTNLARRFPAEAAAGDPRRLRSTPRRSRRRRSTNSSTCSSSDAALS